MMRVAWLGLAIVAVGCSDGMLGVDHPDRATGGPLLTTQAGQFDFLDRPAGAEGLPKFGVDISLWSGEITDAEVGCWYAEGVRHVIAGTQNYRITRQQIEESLEGGMSVDAYLYLHWTENVPRRVRADIEMLADYPIGRYWIDVEADPEGRSVQQMSAKVREALDTCDEVGVACGIYTAAWWWVPHMRDSAEFSDVPLWYAYYDEDPSMKTWETQQFGGWELPWGKQWTEVYFCGIDVDKNTIFTSSDPVAPPKDFTPTGTLEVPTGLYPDDLEQVKRETVRVLVDTVPGAQQYEFQVEHYRWGKWLTYATFRSSTPAYRFSSVVQDRVMRFRARASAAGATTDWSPWAVFQKGNPTEFPPLEVAPEPTPEPDVDPEPTPDPAVEPTPDPVVDPSPEPTPPPVAGAPQGLSPADLTSLPNGAAANLSCAAVEGADRYEFEIQNYNTVRGEWVAYYTYAGAQPARRFYPARDLAYRWRVRARTAAGMSPDSAWQRFQTGNATSP